VGQRRHAHDPSAERAHLGLQLVRRHQPVEDAPLGGPLRIEVARERKLERAPTRGAAGSTRPVLDDWPW
jgi:hypothetical protein